jgi:hypothetical protein
MYWLLGIDTVLRITAAIVFLFVVVPWLAWRRPRSFARLEWFWWCLGAGMIALTLTGQLLTIFNIASSPMYVLLIAATVLLLRARRNGTTAFDVIRKSYRLAVLLALNVLEGRVSIRRRAKRRLRATRARIHAALGPARVRWIVGAWIAVVSAAAVTRLYRPFATANLGFSDTYGHLYLMRLLDAGKQVDPAWGPYPLGMHFLLVTIERLTNADSVLLMNFFGAFSGILITMAVADTARRISRSMTGALVAGLAFATMIGGASQYFLLGGSVSTDNPAVAAEALRRPYAGLADAGEFDVLLTVFQRQCATLPQELATVLLFPAALFLLDWLRRKEDRRYRLSGFVLCTAAIAATHSGVVVPLVLLCAVAAITALLERSTSMREIGRAALIGAAGVLAGCSWMLGYIRYGNSSTAPQTQSTALYYFPFLRRFGEGYTDVTYVMVTPFLIAMLVVAACLAWVAFSPPRREKLPQTDQGSAPWTRGPTLWIALVYILFFLTHAAATLHLPEIVEARRNAIWLAMSIAALLGVAASAIAQLLARAVDISRRRRVAAAIPAVAVVAWLFTVPALFAAPLRGQIIDYSGYGSTALAVVKISRSFEPYSWTLVSYGQEFPMVLGRGFHLSAVDFIEQFDPAEQRLRVPTRYVFIAVEKRPHRFQINNWAVRFDRTALEERLQTWCSLYGLTHGDMRVYLDDENVRVYMIEPMAETTTKPQGAGG